MVDVNESKTRYVGTGRCSGPFSSILGEGIDLFSGRVIISSFDSSSSSYNYTISGCFFSSASWETEYSINSSFYVMKSISRLMRRFECEDLFNFSRLFKILASICRLLKSDLNFKMSCEVYVTFLINFSTSASA